ncbi:helix-turn-helix domain-containing protein [Amycolatopsis sp. WGS_07]|uniref:helix-turn-helix domain-containing protein n=1 Tax=Amycolatopsis sp. WGS_07 TaxID=3076764 RepID=UPI003873701A
MDGLYFTGTEATALRIAMDCSAKEFAEHLGVSVPTVNAWASRTRGVDPGPRSQELLATLLRRQKPAVQERFYARGGPVPAVLSPADLDEEADVSAEEAVALAGRTAGLVGDVSLADRLEIELSRLSVAYVHEPLPKVFRGLRDVQRELDRALVVPRSPAGQSRLLWLSAATGLHLAHACQNLGRTGAALKHVFAARTLADAVDSDALRAASHATTALLLEWSQKPGQAVLEARKGLSYQAGAHTRRRLRAIAARAAARAGDVETAQAMLRFVEAGREPGIPDVDAIADIGGLMTFPAAKLQYYIGGVNLLLHRPELADRHSSFAIETYLRGTEHDCSYGDLALARLNRAGARLQQGDAAGAIEDVAAALTRSDGQPLPEEQRITQFGSALVDLHRRAQDLQRRGVPDADAVAGQITNHLPSAVPGLPSPSA